MMDKESMSSFHDVQVFVVMAISVLLVFRVALIRSFAEMVYLQETGTDILLLRLSSCRRQALFLLLSRCRHLGRGLRLLWTWCRFGGINLKLL